MKEGVALNKSNDEKDRQKVAIVTGSSSGIGYATSLMLARNGFYTYASVRNINKSATRIDSQCRKATFEIDSARCY